MNNRLSMLLITLLSLFLVGCGSVDTSSDEPDSSSSSSSSTIEVDDVTGNVINDTTSPLESNGDLSISGKITFDRIGVNANRIGLDHEHVQVLPARRVTVKAIGSSNEVVATTSTDDQGEYRLEHLPENTEIKIRVYSEMLKTGDGGWDVKVQDNTNGDATYVLEGSLISTGTSNTRRSLHAPLGWDSSVNAYTSTRASAPFAILDSIYGAMKKVIDVDSKTSFPKLLVNWSVHNIAAGNGSEAGLADGQIITSHYDGGDRLYILGDANSDTDEFDDHIIIHEWAHYFESKFSRSDSIGGAHGAGDHLDIRVAFGEGWGNAFSAIATDNPIYFDTVGVAQSSGWYMDIEGERKVVPGWFSEASVQRILYDLYDSHDDEGDRLSLGFAPIYKVLVGPQKETKAFTSIFSFITALKLEVPEDRSKIDSILASEDIGSIEEIYGNTFYLLYADMDEGQTINVCTSSRYGIGNKLDNHRYIRLNIYGGGSYTVRVVQTNGSRSDPDFGIFKTVPFEQIGLSEETTLQQEEARYHLDAGGYLLDISDYNDLTEACFDVSVTN